MGGGKGNSDEEGCESEEGDDGVDSLVLFGLCEGELVVVFVCLFLFLSVFFLDVFADVGELFHVFVGLFVGDADTESVCHCECISLSIYLRLIFN